MAEEFLRGSVGLSEEAPVTLVQRYGASPLMLSIVGRALRDGTATVQGLLNAEQGGFDLNQLLLRSVTRLSPGAQRLLQRLGPNGLNTRPKTTAGQPQDASARSGAADAIPARPAP